MQITKSHSSFQLTLLQKQEHKILFYCFLLLLTKDHLSYAILLSFVFFCSLLIDVEQLNSQIKIRMEKNEVKNFQSVTRNAITGWALALTALATCCMSKKNENEMII